MIRDVRQLVSAHDLLREWTGRTLQARYQQSLLGWLWAIVQPAAQTLILAMVFTRVLPVDTGDTPYLLFSYAAMVPWAFLATSLSDMATSIVDNMNLVTKVYFPREALPIASMLARLLDFGIAFALLVVLACYYQVPLLSPALLVLPIVVALQIVLIAGLGLALAAGNVFVRDVRSLLVLGTQLWFYASPVIYPVDAVPESFRRYYLANPMAGIIEAYRAVMVRGEMPDGSLVVAGVTAATVFVIGYSVFKRAEARFADVV
jgi:lipopolysaccharide transport system permease protein